ncbi:MAG: hypothetical protein ACOH5I_02975 [Oligoflexus sp.]
MWLQSLGERTFCLAGFLFISACAASDSKDQTAQTTSSNQERKPGPVFRIEIEQPSLAVLDGLEAAEGLQASLVISPTRKRCSIDEQRYQEPYQPGSSIAIEVDEICDFQVYLSIAPAGADFRDSSRSFGYEEDIVPLINQYCFSCHNPESESTNDMTSYENVFGRRDLVRNHVIAGTMPPPPSTMFPDEVFKFDHWVKQNAPRQRLEVGGQDARPIYLSKRIAVAGSQLATDKVVSLQGEFKRAE